MRFYRLKEWKDGDKEESLNEMYGILSSVDRNLLTIEDFEDFRRSSARHYFITGDGCDEHTLVGVGAVDLPNGTIKRMYIFPEYRGKGYGSRFVKMAEGLLAEDGAKTSVIFVRRTNPKGILWWIQRGYFPKDNPHHDTFTSLYMERKIGGGHDESTTHQIADSIRSAERE